jgi:hypothetical protein
LTPEFVQLQDPVEPGVGTAARERAARRLRLAADQPEVEDRRS